MSANSKHATPLTAYRGMLLHFLSDPGEGNDMRAVQFFDDGVLVVEDGRVKSVGPALSVLARLADTVRVIDCAGRLILPGFVDTHIHYPQTDMIASYGNQLLDWLERYTYPAEAAFTDAEHARDVAEFFLDELLRNGTTTAMVFATVHAVSVDVFFRSAAALALWRRLKFGSANGDSASSSLRSK